MGQQISNGNGLSYGITEYQVYSPMEDKNFVEHEKKFSKEWSKRDPVIGRDFIESEKLQAHEANQKINKAADKAIKLANESYHGELSEPESTRYSYTCKKSYYASL